MAIVGAGKAASQLIDTVYAENKYMPVVLYDNSDKIIGKKLLNIPIKKLSIENILSDSGIGLFDEIIKLPINAKNVLVRWTPSSQAANTPFDGKEISLKITVLSANEKKLPELNDDFAKEVGADSLEKLREQIKFP